MAEIAGVWDRSRRPRARVSAPEQERAWEREEIGRCPKPIASICPGAQILTPAGVVKGRKIDVYPACQPEVNAAGGEFVSLPFDGAVTDGNYVTGPTWSAGVEWLKQF